MGRHIGVGKETTYGTPVTVTEFSDLKSESMGKELATEEVSTLRAWGITKVNLLNSKVGGDIEIAGNYQDCGLLFKALYGSNDVTGTGPYTHTFPASTGIPAAGRDGLSLTAEIQRDSAALTFRYAGCKVVGYSLAADASSSPVMTWSFLGKSEGYGTATTASLPTADLMTPPHVTVSFDAVALNAESVNITAAFGIDEPYKMGSAEFALEPISNTAFGITGDVTVYFVNSTQYAKFDGTTDVDIIVAITDGTHSLTHNINKARLTQVGHAMTFRERLKATYSFSAYHDTTATSSMQTILVNDDVTVP